MKIVLISCVAKKRNLSNEETIAAKDLYISSLFIKTWKYAQFFNADRIYILSAKFGLVSPYQELSTYNETLVGKSITVKREWSKKVLYQMEEEGIKIAQDEFIILAGENYYKYLIGNRGIVNYQLPLKGMPIGKRLQFLKEQIDNRK